MPNMSLTNAERAAKLAAIRQAQEAAAAVEAEALKARAEEEEIDLAEKLGPSYLSSHVVVPLDTPSELPGQAVFRPLTPVEFRALQGTSKSKDPEAQLRLVAERNLVYPTKERWAAVMESHPGAYQEPIKALIARANGESKKA